MILASTSAPAFPDLTRAPFAIDQTDPAVAAGEIVACFRQLLGLRERTTRAFSAVAGRIPLAPDGVQLAAGRAIAAAMDGDARGIGRNPYHNCLHTCEVLLCSHYVARRHRLPPEILGRIALAALIHDFGHDGTGNQGIAFRLEQAAVDKTRGLLLDAGIDAAEADRIGAMVLATELPTGTPFARACLHRLRGATPPGDPAPPDNLLSLLADDADLAFQAVLLTECDLLPSIGLTIDYAMTSQVRLAREDPRIVAGPAAKQAFLDGYVADLVVADFFQPNLERLRRFVRDSLRGENPGRFPDAQATDR